MGKKRTQSNREAKRQFKFDENIQQVLREDDEYRKNMASILGPPGPDEPKILYLEPPKTKQIVDCLGRVVSVPVDHNNIPTALRSTMSKKTSQSSLYVPARDERRVTLMRDHELNYPELWMEIFVQPDPAVRDDEARFAQMFARSRCSKAKSAMDADLVIFAGGDDVDPALYGEKQHSSTCINPKRDRDDMDLYLMCVEKGIPMLGVCRGAQFLSVMNGGKLWQHVDKHYGDHKIYDIRRREFINKVSSVHHQMVRSNRDNGMEIIATNGDARNRWANPTDPPSLGAKADIEAFFYRDTCCLGVQGHPEYQGYNAFTKWVLELINEYVLCSPDIEWRDRNRRIKQELLEERNHAIAVKQETT